MTHVWAFHLTAPSTIASLLTLYRFLVRPQLLTRV